jgi:hypothetical protein
MKINNEYVLFIMCFIYSSLYDVLQYNRFDVGFREKILENIYLILMILGKSINGIEKHGNRTNNSNTSPENDQDY